jgi:hypothetical protein
VYLELRDGSDKDEFSVIVIAGVVTSGSSGMIVGDSTAGRFRSVGIQSGTFPTTQPTE